MPRSSDRREFYAEPRRDRRSAFSVLALRQRSDEHPMAMFFIIVALATAAAALISPSRAALASFGDRAIESAPASGEASRLAASEAGIACRGQAWGAESEACLAVIARESGKAEGLKIRLIAAAGNPSSMTPNVFR